MTPEVRWKSWGGAALLTGAASLMLFLMRVGAGVGVMGFPHPAILAILLLFPFCAILAWRSNERGLAAGGCLMWIVPALAALMTLLFVIGLAFR